jgi:ABC-type dipeptide/oligopeptide/nickel transport system permease component
MTRAVTVGGDAEGRVARQDPDESEAQAADDERDEHGLDQELGLDRPWPELLLRWFGELAKGHLGNSLVSGEPGSDQREAVEARPGPQPAHEAERQADQQGQDEGAGDRPWPELLLRWFGELAKGHLGNSLVSGEPVSEEPQRHGSDQREAVEARPGPQPAHEAERQADQQGQDLGLVLMLVFSIRLEWLPPAGYGTWREMALPSLTRTSTARSGRPFSRAKR